MFITFTLIATDFCRSFHVFSPHCITHNMIWFWCFVNYKLFALIMTFSILRMSASHVDAITMNVFYYDIWPREWNEMTLMMRTLKYEMRSRTIEKFKILCTIENAVGKRQHHSSRGLFMVVRKQTVFLERWNDDEWFGHITWSIISILWLIKISLKFSMAANFGIFSLWPFWHTRQQRIWH